MIKYALQCANGHAFDGWFRSSDAYDRQVRRHLVTCPNCGVTEVEKQPMAPALVKTREAAGKKSQTSHRGPGESGPTRVEREGPPVEVLRAFRRHVLDNSEDVGPRFADEARKIHHGEADARAIRGEASQEEAIKLHEEGVEFGILPVLPEDHN